MQNKKIADQMKRAPTEAGFLNEACALYRDESSPVDDPLTPFRLELDRLSGEADRSGIQVGCSVRNVALARFLAQRLIDSEGHFDPVENRALLSLLKHRLYSLEPNRQHDVARMEHITDAMQKLDKSKELVDKLNRIQKPFQNTRVEELIRLSLELPSSEKITDRLTRVAVLSAWLTYLRQSVGSCFATAPAIIVQTEMPEVFFDDLTALIHSCQLKRVIAGREHAVPMSLTWGVGELRRQFLLERTQDDSSQPIWCSPALQKAFTATGFVTIEGEREVRAEMTKEILLSLLSRWEGDGYTVQTSAEEIIRRFLMRHLELSRENISEVESRPEISLSALSGSISSSRSADLMGRYQRLQRLEEAAQNTFKIHSDHALLRTWEYTLASFAETKADFTKWNLYTSLGLDEKEPGGIGEALFHAIKGRLDACNEQVHDYTEQYETLYTRIKYLEVRLQRASNEEEGSYLKAEYRSLSQELQTLQELREQEHQKARRYSELFADLIEVFIALFPEYFQEVYDADLHEVDVGPYDDSPAGFRLLFKHGRSNPSAWTLVKTPAEYGDSLAQFFSMTETRITQHEHFNGLEEDISTIVSALVAHVRTTEFLENALHRMCKAHDQPLLKNPLDHLSAIEKKPWAYTSGGAMNTLVANYFGREDDPTEKSRWVENELELLTFLVDCVKEMPYKEEEVYLKDVKRSLLIHSPTHAFLFRPGFQPLSKAIQNDAYTYIWVRDHLKNPAAEFVEALYLQETQMVALIDLLAQNVPHEIRHYFQSIFRNLPSRLRIVEFRDFILTEVSRYSKMRGQRRYYITADQIDSLLYRTLPYSERSQMPERLRRIFETLPGLDQKGCDALIALYEELSWLKIPSTFIPAWQLKETALGLLVLHFKRTYMRYPYHLLVAEAMQRYGYALPKPIVFADTNWITDFFAFVINPSNGEMELWCVDATGMEGHPISSWKKWLDGSTKNPTWGVYVRPHEYRL